MEWKFDGGSVYGYEVRPVIGPSTFHRRFDVSCDSRDRLAFSKSILRRFIRDCVDRNPAVASPWIVKKPVADRYGVETLMPEATRQGVEDIKKGEIQKRKKVWEDKEGPVAKKPKKMTPLQEERGPYVTSRYTLDVAHTDILFGFTAKNAAIAAEKKEREAKEKVERQAKAKEEAERLAAEKAAEKAAQKAKEKKKPVRYPTEDLDVTLSEKEKKAGMKVKRPVPSRVSLPFNDKPGVFESFLMTWNFLVVYGYVFVCVLLVGLYLLKVSYNFARRHPFHLSTFTLDEFEQALRHSVDPPTCELLAEVHSALIYNLRTVPFTRHSAVTSLWDLKSEEPTESTEQGITIEELVSALAGVGNNWEREPLRHADGRVGWEESLVGCLKDVRISVLFFCGF